MSLAANTKGRAAAASANRADYRASFLRHVHRLVQLGYESLDRAACANAEEETITGRIRSRMKYLTEVKPTEKWMQRYAVHEEDTIDGVKDAKTSRLREGKDRPVIDTRIVSKARLPNARFCIEAKRLYRSDSVAEYVGSAGLEALLSEYTTISDDTAGMLGYVQARTQAEWENLIRTKIEQTAALRTDSSAGVLESLPLREGPRCVRRTLHLREGAASLVVLHTFLDFTS